MHGGNHEIIHDFDFTFADGASWGRWNRSSRFWNVLPFFISDEAGFDVADTIEVFLQFLNIVPREATLKVLRIFEDSVDPIRDAIEDEAYSGIYDRDNEANPFKDWWHVVVPYCTGDVHWGNSSQLYGSGVNEFVIEHKGAVNSQAVLDWVYANFRGPPFLSQFQNIDPLPGAV